MRTLSHRQPIVRSLFTAGAALATAALLTTPVAAQGRWGRDGYGYGNGSGGYDQDGYGRSTDGARPLFSWSGRVDHEAYIVMQNGDVRTRIDSHANGAGGQVRVASALPQADGMIDVRLEEGRGRVDVVEQPSSRNGYRAVVRVRDDDAGAGYYRFVTTWRPNGGYAGGSDRRGGWDRDGRDRDGAGRDGGQDRRGRDGNGEYGGSASNGGYGNGGYDNGTYAGSGTLHWRGRVDDVEEIRLQGNRVDVRTVSGAGASGVRSQLSGGALPARDVTVRVNGREGRGRVTVVQQPHAWNGYTTVVRVEDRDAGPGWYDFDVSW
ncbi:hypothetical protein tb265_12110 [Gemmatimonadetes bacterium T265]|nr:hypothetical protein tb265_12110 [Gemmatimonadetes bacterium T265]